MKVIVFDLDDTLCKEIDFLKSAYKEIAAYAAWMCGSSSVPVHVLEVKVYEAMLEAYYNGRNAFDALNEYLGLDLPVSDLLRVYREHIPQMSLDDDIRYTLNRLKGEGTLMGIVSDGREITQWNKIKVLGLTEWMDESCIIINSSPECFKPNPCGYERLEAVVRTLSHGEELTITYVGDNLKKDFIYPRQKGWHTICLKDDGRNIHSQNFDSTPVEALPDSVIVSLQDLFK